MSSSKPDPPPRGGKRPLTQFEKDRDRAIWLREQIPDIRRRLGGNWNRQDQDLFDEYSQELSRIEERGHG